MQVELREAVGRQRAPLSAPRKQEEQFSSCCAVPRSNTFLFLLETPNENIAVPHPDAPCSCSAQGTASIAGCCSLMRPQLQDRSIHLEYPGKRNFWVIFFFFSPDIALQVLFLALKASDAAYAGQLGAGTAPCCCTSIPSSPWSPPAPCSAQQLCPQQRPLDVTVVTPMGSVALDWARSV